MKANSIPIDWTLDSTAYVELADFVLNGPGIGVGPQLAIVGGVARGAGGGAASLCEPSSNPLPVRSKKGGKFGKQLNRADDAALCGCLLANLDAISRQPLTTTLGIHLNTAWYSKHKNTLPQFVGRRRVVRLYKLLLAHQLIERTAKGSEQGGSTRVISTAKLRHQFQSLGVMNIQQSNDAGNAIELRGPAIKIKRLATRGKHVGKMISARVPGPPIPFDETDEIAQLRAGMRRINDHLAKARIGWAETQEGREAWKALADGIKGMRRSAPNLTRVRLKRIFNMDWESGGRLYGGWWQSVSGKYRHHITIDDQPTVELDWESLHLRLCYALSGIPAPYMEEPGHWYSLPGIDPAWRRIIKALTNQMLNCESDAKAIRATMDEREKTTISKKPGELSDLDYWRTFKADGGPRKGAISRRLGEWATRIRAHHHQVAHWFDDPSTGRRLQYVDSLLVQAVLFQANKLGITALPIHDSLIVAEHHAETVRKIMDRTFNIGAGGGIFGQLGDGIKAVESAYRQLNKKTLAGESSEKLSANRSRLSNVV